MCLLRFVERGKFLGTKIRGFRGRGANWFPRSNTSPCGPGFNGTYLLDSARNSVSLWDFLFLNISHTAHNQKMSPHAMNAIISAFVGWPELFDAMTPETQQKLYVGLYLGVLLAGCVLTFLLYRVGETISANRTAEAKRDAARAYDSAGVANKEAGRANEEAAKANERAANLERENLANRERVAMLEKEATEARTRQTEAEKLSDFVLHRGVPRANLFDREAFFKILKGKPKAKVEILYEKENLDSWLLAKIIEAMLKKAEWSEVTRRPLREADALNLEWLADAPLSVRAGAENGGAGIVARQVPSGAEALSRETAFGALMWGLNWAGSLTSPSHSDPRMPEGLLRIVVGQKY